MSSLCMRTVLGVVGLIVSALALASCSVFGDEPYPDAQPAFWHTVRPSLAPCVPPDCEGWDTEAVLTAKADSSFGFGEGLTTFVLLALPHRDVSLFDSGLRASDLDLIPGRAYRFESNFMLFGLVFPNPSALRVSDSEGLVLYGGSTAALPGTDTEGSGLDELLLLPEGWEVRVGDADFGSESVSCAQETPHRVEVEYEGATLRLVQGESGRLGPFDVQIRAARRLLYDGSCIDGYQHEFSMVIARRAA